MRQFYALAAAAMLAVTGPAFAEVANDAQTLALSNRLDNTTFARDKIEIGNRLAYWAPVFETLLTIMPDGSIAPNLATEWSYNEDSTVLTLKLREGVKFTDGSPFDAEAVKANLDFLKNGTGQNVWMVKSIASYEIVSPSEIKVVLSEPDPALVRNLTLVAGAIASPASLGTEEGARIPVGTGPYVYDAQQTVIGRQYVYTRNPDYWNAEAFPFDVMTIAPMTDLSARINALKAGQIDVAPVEAQSVAEGEASGMRVTRNPVNWQGIFFADREGKMNPAIANLKVRQALNMAFDTASILKYVEQGYGVVSDQIFPKTSAAYVAELDDYYPYDPEKAKALLAEAGLAEGLTLKLPEATQFAAYNPIIEQQLKDVGVGVEWVKVAPDALISDITAGKFGVFFFRLGNQSDWGDLLKLAFPTSAWNPLRPADAEMAALLETAQKASAEDQPAAFQAINRYMVENAWYAPWYRPDAINLTSQEVIEEPIPGNVVTFPQFYRPAE
jgi:peptide/nickel transport system substrate-binding protein